MPIKISHDLKVSYKDFVKKVMKPATGKSETSIVKNYPSLDPLRIKYSYGSLIGPEIIEAYSRYPGKVKHQVAEDKIKQVDDEYRRAKARKMEIELEVRGGVPHEIRAERKKYEIEKMRTELAKGQKIKLKLETEAQRKRNIERTKASEQERVEDLPID